MHACMHALMDGWTDGWKETVKCMYSACICELFFADTERKTTESSKYGPVGATGSPGETGATGATGPWVSLTIDTTTLPERQVLG